MVAVLREIYVGLCVIERILSRGLDAPVKFASPVACTYGKRYVTNLKHEVLFDCPPYVWRSGTSDGLFLPNYPPRNMRVILFFDNL